MRYNNIYIYTGWWFQTFFIFTSTWGRFPFWLIFFKWVETTNQYTYPWSILTPTYSEHTTKKPHIFRKCSGWTCQGWISQPFDVELYSASPGGVSTGGSPKCGLPTGFKWNPFVFFLGGWRLKQCKTYIYGKFWDNCVLFSLVISFWTLLFVFFSFGFQFWFDLNKI